MEPGPIENGVNTVTLVLAATLVATLQGCHNSMNDDLTGAYALVSVNGKHLPARVYQGRDSHQDVVSGTLHLGADGAVEFVTNSELGMFGLTQSQNDTARGRYTAGKGAITLAMADGSFATLTHAGDELTMQFELVFVWKRVTH